MFAPVDFSGHDRITPFWFGPQASRLLGWYHAPHGAVVKGAVLLCSPFGHEYLVSYRSYRKLAETLADAGLACLFFDYDGTGDSAASELPRVEAWRNSIIFAARELRTLSGVSSVVLFGTRLGALLAASVASEVSASAIVMLAPVVAGRAFVREQLSFARMSPLATVEESRQKLSDEEVVGYPLSKATQQDLATLDLTKMQYAAPTFIIERDDMPGQVAKLVSAWQSAGGSVEVSPAAGYAAMMTEDAHSASVPTAIWAEVRDWLLARLTTSTPVQAEDGQLPRSMRVENHYVEEVVVFNGLAGIITTPSWKLPRKTGVVLTNIGTSHRVGNHLLYVHLARSLAALGYSVIRFDRAGTGYSRATPEGLENDVYAASGIDDVRFAVDCLQTRCPCTRVVLAGLCSGAYFSYHAAVLDARVKGLVLINLLTFQWQAGDSLETRIRESNKSTDFYLRSVLEAHTWVRIIKGEVAVKRIAIALVKRAGKKLLLYVHALLKRAAGKSETGGVVAENFRQMLKRKVRVFFIFGADDASQDVVAAELGPDASLLKSPTKIRIETVRATDHTFTPLWSQAHLRESVGQFMLNHFR